MNKKKNPIIIGGDCNMIRNNDLDYMGTSKKLHQSRFDVHFEQFLDSLTLLDIWRTRNGIKRQFTYRQVNPFMQSRLDYWFISEKLEEIVLKCNIIPSIAPDHSAVQLHFYNMPSNSLKMKGSYWKINNSLSKDDEYIKYMKEQIIKLKEEYQAEIEDKRVLWDEEK